MIRATTLGLIVTVALLNACGASGGSPTGSSSGASSGTGAAAHGGSASAGSGTGGSLGVGAGGGTSAGGFATTGGGTSAGGSNAAGGTLGAAGASGGSAGGGTSGSPGAGGTGGATSSSGDIVGKVTVGYQGWFNAAGDGSGINPPWWHWTADRNTPSPSDNGVKSWPDVSELTTTYSTSFANLGNGSPAKLYSNWDASTVDTQIKWMADTGIDTVALQRFGDFRDTNGARNTVAAHVRDAAQAHGRKFYIMYDISGWDTFDTDLKSDWTDHIVGELHLTDSPAYAKQDGKPVVCIWGLGYTGHPGTTQTTQDIIDYFHGKG
ncbi:MAG TPA: hypothetical protein VNW92_01195, partial [Polyangiaceae bacterium]|nr:hypothetical protein [Polyangiaceae bacterium]